MNCKILRCKSYIKKFPYCTIHYYMGLKWIFFYKMCFNLSPDLFYFIFKKCPGSHYTCFNTKLLGYFFDLN